MANEDTNLDKLLAFMESESKKKELEDYGQDFGNGVILFPPSGRDKRNKEALANFSNFSNSMDEKVLSAMRGFGEGASKAEASRKESQAAMIEPFLKFIQGEAPNIQAAKKKFGIAGALGAGTRSTGKLVAQGGKSLVTPATQFLAGMELISGDSVNNLKESDTQSVIKEVTDTVADVTKEAASQLKGALLDLDPSYSEAINVTDILNEAKKKGSVPLFRVGKDTKVNGKGSFSKMTSNSPEKQGYQALFESIGMTPEQSQALSRFQAAQPKRVTKKIRSSNGVRSVETMDAPDSNPLSIIAKVLEAKQGKEATLSADSPEFQAKFLAKIFESSTNPKERSNLIKMALRKQGYSEAEISQLDK